MKYFPKSVRHQKKVESTQLVQRDSIVAEYEAKFTQLSCFAPTLIANEKYKTFRFQDGLNPFMKDKVSFLKLETYLEVVNNTLLAKGNSKELQHYKKQQRKCRPSIFSLATCMHLGVSPAPNFCMSQPQSPC